MVHIHRDHVIRIHVSLVTVDHQIRILPEIPRAISLARSSRGRILAGGDHGTGLQTIPVFVFDGVLLVIEHRIQPLVKMGHVVSAIEIVVDKNLPVAMNVVAPAIEEVQLADPQRRHALHQSAKELLQRHRLRIKVRENKALPSAHSNRH